MLSFHPEEKAKETKADDENASTAPWVKQRHLKHVTRGAVEPAASTDGANNNNPVPGAPATAHNVGGATIFSTGPPTKVDKSFSTTAEEQRLNEKDLRNGNSKLFGESSPSRSPVTTPSTVDVNSNPANDENSPPSDTSGAESEARTSTVISSLEETSSTSILRNKAQLPSHSNNNQDQGQCLFRCGLSVIFAEVVGRIHNTSEVVNFSDFRT